LAYKLNDIQGADGEDNTSNTNEAKNSKFDTGVQNAGLDKNGNQISDARVTEGSAVDPEEKHELDMTKKEMEEVDKLTRHQSIILRKFAEEKNNLRYKTKIDQEYLGKSKMKEY